MDVTAALETIAVSVSPQEREERTKELSAYMNQLLQNDFAALVQVLYRVDVSEQKLKEILKENPQADAGDLMAELLIQRQQEKALSRESFIPKDKPLEEEEW